MLVTAKLSSKTACKSTMWNGILNLFDSRMTTGLYEAYMEHFCARKVPRFLLRFSLVGVLYHQGRLKINHVPLRRFFRLSEAFRPKRPKKLSSDRREFLSQLPQSEVDWEPVYIDHQDHLMMEDEYIWDYDDSGESDFSEYSIATDDW
jgi:hypothetical protein